jgi:hypothetical protein
MTRKDKRRRERREIARQHADDWATIQAIKHAPFPQIVVDPSDGDPDFVAAVRKALETFAFDDPGCCELAPRWHYKVIGGLGFDEWYQSLPDFIAEEVQNAPDLQAAVSQTAYAVYCHLGKWIFEQLPSRFTSLPIPDYFYRVSFIEKEILVSFRFMETVGDRSNRLYIPPSRPSVVMQGATWTVGLYRHAIERLFLRLSGSPELGYAEWISVYSMLVGKAVLFDHVQLPNGEESLRASFEVSTIPGTSSHYELYVRQVFGEANVRPEAGPVYVVAGYLPLHVQGKYARAKTFLFPGYQATPEDEIARAGNAPPQVRRKLVAMAQDNTFASVIKGDTLECIRWYHENGVPQVFYPSAKQVSGQADSTGG